MKLQITSTTPTFCVTPEKNTNKISAPATVKSRHITVDEEQLNEIEENKD